MIKKRQTDENQKIKQANDSNFDKRNAKFEMTGLGTNTITKTEWLNNWTKKTKPVKVLEIDVNRSEVKDLDCSSPFSFLDICWPNLSTQNLKIVLNCSRSATLTRVFFLVYTLRICCFDPCLFSSVYLEVVIITPPRPVKRLVLKAKIRKLLN